MTATKFEGRAMKARGSAGFSRPSMPTDRNEGTMEQATDPPNDLPLSAYRRARAFDEALIPDRECPHGGRLRSCGWPDCIQTRYGILRRATLAGKRG